MKENGRKVLGLDSGNVIRGQTGKRERTKAGISGEVLAYEYRLGRECVCVWYINASLNRGRKETQV